MASAIQRESSTKTVEFTLTFEDLVKIMADHGVEMEGSRLTICTQSRGSNGFQYGDVIQGVDHLVLRFETRTSKPGRSLP